MLGRLEKAYSNKRSLAALAEAGQIALSTINELLEKDMEIDQLLDLAVKSFSYLERSEKALEMKMFEYEKYLSNLMTKIVEKRQVGKSKSKMISLFRKMHSRLLHLLSIESALDVLSLRDDANERKCFMVFEESTDESSMTILLVIASQINYLKFLSEIDLDITLAAQMIEMKGFLVDWCNMLEKVDKNMGKRQIDTVVKLLFKIISNFTSQRKGDHFTKDYLRLAKSSLQFFSKSSKYDPSLFLDQACIYLNVLTDGSMEDVKRFSQFVIDTYLMVEGGSGLANPRILEFAYYTPIKTEGKGFTAFICYFFDAWSRDLTTMNTSLKITFTVSDFIPDYSRHLKRWSDFFCQGQISRKHLNEIFSMAWVASITEIAICHEYECCLKIAIDFVVNIVKCFMDEKEPVLNLLSSLSNSLRSHCRTWNIQLYLKKISQLYHYVASHYFKKKAFDDCLIFGKLSTCLYEISTVEDVDVEVKRHSLLFACMGNLRAYDSRVFMASLENLLPVIQDQEILLEPLLKELVYFSIFCMFKECDKGAICGILQSFDIRNLKKVQKLGILKFQLDALQRIKKKKDTLYYETMKEIDVLSRGSMSKETMINSLELSHYELCFLRKTDLQILPEIREGAELENFDDILACCYGLLMLKDHQLFTEKNKSFSLSNVESFLKVIKSPRAIASSLIILFKIASSLVDVLGVMGQPFLQIQILEILGNAKWPPKELSNLKLSLSIVKWKVGFASLELENINGEHIFTSMQIYLECLINYEKGSCDPYLNSLKGRKNTAENVLKVAIAQFFSSKYHTKMGDLGSAISRALDCLANLNSLISHEQSLESKKVTPDCIFSCLSKQNSILVLEIYILVLLKLVELYKYRGSLKEAEYYLDQGISLALRCYCVGYETEFLLEKVDIMYRQEKFEESSLILDSVDRKIQENYTLDAKDNFFAKVLTKYHRLEILSRTMSESPSQAFIEVDDSEYEDLLEHTALLSLQKGKYLVRNEIYDDGLNILEPIRKVLRPSEKCAIAHFAYARGNFERYKAKAGVKQQRNFIVDKSNFREKSGIGKVGSNVHEFECVRKELEKGFLLARACGSQELVSQICFSMIDLVMVMQQQDKRSPLKPDCIYELSHRLVMSQSVSLCREMLSIIDDKIKKLGDADESDLLEALTIQRDMHLDDINMKPQIFHREYVEDLIPDHWIVVSIMYNQSEERLVFHRLEKHQSPVIFVKGLSTNRKKSFLDLCDEMNLILGDSKKSFDLASSCGKSEWWSIRKKLDQRLENLVQEIENVIFGGLQGLFRNVKDLEVGYCDCLESIIFDLITKRKSRSKSKKNPRMDANLAWHFRQLGRNDGRRINWDGMKCLLSFLYEMGVSSDGDNNVDFVPIESVDIGLICERIKCLNDEFDMKTESLVSDELVFELEGSDAKGEGVWGLDEMMMKKRSHVVLILDKKFQGLPFESCPSLKGRSVSRVPCYSILRDILVKQRMNRLKDVKAFEIDSKSCFYVLNPSGDLKSTQTEFENDLRGVREWNGIVGRIPSMDEMKKALEKHDLFLYFGHSSGEQYIPSHYIKRIKTCPTSILMGCSSGMLRSAGEFGPWGPALAYLMAGSPCVIANLWDVTDKDIDRFTRKMFESWGLIEAEIRRDYKDETRRNYKDETRSETRFESRSESRSESKRYYNQVTGKPNRRLFQSIFNHVDICRAVAESRSVCKLPWLVGSSPICYGIPMNMFTQENN